MGNQEGSLTSRQSSTLSDMSSSEVPAAANGCPYAPQGVYRGSSDSDSTSSGIQQSNNNTIHKLSICPDEDVLQTAAHKMVPLKQRKVSRAASASRVKRPKGVVGIGSISTKADVMQDSLKDIVEETWASIHQIMPCPIAIGCAIYQRIFTASPKLRSLFRIPEEVTELTCHPPFHRSAKLFTSVIELCVRNIYSLDADMGPVLVMYGRRHYHYLRDWKEHEGGFRNLYLPLFNQCIFEFIFDTLPDEERSDAAQHGWRALLGYVLAKTAEGYDAERYRNSRLRRKSVQ